MRTVQIPDHVTPAHLALLKRLGYGDPFTSDLHPNQVLFQRKVRDDLHIEVAVNTFAELKDLGDALHTLTAKRMLFEVQLQITNIKAGYDYFTGEISKKMGAGVSGRLSKGGNGASVGLSGSGSGRSGGGW